MKNFSDTVGNRTLDLQARSAVSQPTAPTPILALLPVIKIKTHMCLISLNITPWRCSPLHILKFGIGLASRPACSNPGTQWVVA